ncbi:MAG TPA: RNA methyltransferase [Polyangiaceae bacterium]
MKFFATAARGTEPALRDELRELGFAGVRADRGGVHFEGEEREGYRACLWSRIALRVLAPLASFDAGNERALYDGVRAIDLDAVLTPKQTLVVSAVTRSSRLTHTEYLCQLTKDAVVDRIRDARGARPSVSKRDADVHLYLHLARDVATLYLDLAGETLNRRGFRERGAEAPLKETLAAALLRYSSWDRQGPLADPLCGSGTLLIEAGLWSKDVAPGRTRRLFGFERWASFDRRAQVELRELREAAHAAELPKAAPLFGRDVSGEVLALARSSSARGGFDVRFEQGALRDAHFEGGAAIVANPPYGRRLERSADLGKELARLADRHPDSHVALLLDAEQPLARTRRRPGPPRDVYNGNIACVVRTWLAREAGGESGEFDREPA